MEGRGQVIVLANEEDVLAEAAAEVASCACAGSETLRTMGIEIILFN